MEDITNTYQTKKRKTKDEDLQILDVPPTSFYFDLGISSHKNSEILKKLTQPKSEKKTSGFVEPVKSEVESSGSVKELSHSGRLSQQPVKIEMENGIQAVEPDPDLKQQQIEFCTVQTSTGAVSKYIPEVLCEEDILIAEQLELQHEQDLALFYKSELEQELQVLPNDVSICESDDDEEAINEWCNLSYDVYLSQSQKVEIKVQEKEDTLAKENLVTEIEAETDITSNENIHSNADAVIETAAHEGPAVINEVPAVIKDLDDDEEEHEEEDLENDEEEEDPRHGQDEGDDDDDGGGATFAPQLAEDFPEDEDAEEPPSEPAPKDPKSSRFRGLDQKEVRSASEGGERGSKHSDKWATNAFNEWREFMGYGIEKSIGELSEQSDVRGFVDMLHDFALQVTKKDGTLYPPQSIQNMLRAIGRVIRLQQERRIIKTSVMELPFDIFKDVRYRKVKFAGDEAVKRSFRKGLGTRVNTSDVLTFEEEIMVLQSHGASLEHPAGINSKLLYYFCRNFFIRGQEECRATNVNQFELFEEVGTEILRYKPTLSKNYKFTIDRCAAHSLRKPVDCRDPEIIRTWKAMLLHRPELKKLNKKFGDLPHPVFLMPKLKIKRNDIVWFQPRPVGKNTLCHMVKNLIESTPGIDLAGRKFTNKTPRRMGITRMEEAHIPSEKGMAVTGHRDVKSYKQYNAKTDSTEMQACQRIISGISTISGDGKVLKFSDVLTEEERKVNLKKEGDVQSALKLLPKEEKKEVETVHAGTKAQNSTVASCDVGFDSGAFQMQDVRSFSFGSVSGCNMFNFTGMIDPALLSTLVGQLQGNTREKEKC